MNSHSMLVVILAGLALQAFALCMFILWLVRRKRCDETTDATIVETRPYGGRGNNVRITVQFEARGEIVTATEKIGASPKFKNRVGDRVGVRYNPDDPTEVFVDENHMQRRAILLCLISGVVFVVMGLGLAGYAEFGRILALLPRPVQRLAMRIRYLVMKVFRQLF